MDCDSKNIGSSPIIYLLYFNFLKFLAIHIKKLKKKNRSLSVKVVERKKFFWYFLEQGEFFKIFVFNFYLKKFLSTFFFNFFLSFFKKNSQSLKIFFKMNYIFFFINLKKLSYFKKKLFFWKILKLQCIHFNFSINSRYNFNFEKRLGKTTITTSSGILLKFYRLSGKSIRHKKKIFKLGLLFFSKFFKKKKKTLFIFRGIHKNFSLYLNSLFKIWEIPKEMYFFSFFFKKFNNFNFGKKKKSIPKKFKKRLYKKN